MSSQRSLESVKLSNDEWSKKVQATISSLGKQIKDEDRKAIEACFATKNAPMLHQIIVGISGTVSLLDEDEPDDEDAWEWNPVLYELAAEYTGDILLSRETEDYLSKEQGKYFDLVWYARTGPAKEGEERPADIEEGRTFSVARVERDWPKEVKELCEDETNWQHGFNSGMLACLRMIQSCLFDGLENAVEEFPFLDT